MARKPRAKKTAKKQVKRDGALPLAKTKLADAVAALTHWRLKTIPGHGGDSPRVVRINSRYDELCEAIESARGGSGGRWSHQLPFWADAMVLQMEIDTEVAKMHSTPEGWKGWTKQRLAALEQKKWRPQDCPVIRTHTTTLEVFVKRIDQLFAPRPIALPDPCPECKSTWIYRDSDGEKVRTLALQITEDGCTCGHCKSNWPIERLQLLGKILERARNAAEEERGQNEQAV